MEPWIAIALLGAAFLGSHLVLSHPPVRDALIARLSPRGFLGAYSVVALVVMAPWVGLWWTHRHAGPIWWVARGPVSTHTAELLTVIGFGLMVGGVFEPSPNSLSAKAGDTRVRGLTGLTRHPLMMGIALWSAAHLIVNGWAGDVAFFGFMLATALLGAAHQDYRKSADPAYAEFRAQTTFLPIPRPATFRALDPMSLAGVATGVFVAIVLRVFHARLFS